MGAEARYGLWLNHRRIRAGAAAATMKGLFHAFQLEYHPDADMADALSDHEDEIELTQSWFEYPR